MSEVVPWSDALGLSTLVDAIAHPRPAGATESTVLGPFWADGSPDLAYGDAIYTAAAGEPAWVHRRVPDLDGTPIAGATLDAWQNDANELTHIFDAESPDVDSDAIFAVKRSLLRRFVRDGERWSVENNIVLASAR